jgi:glutathione synthase/RimK-type ligase-like ATP-grasp enzyme
MPLVHWTLAKTYMRDLEQRGAAIVPSIWIDEIDAAQIPGWFDALATDSVVIKPQVGANAQDTYLLSHPLQPEMVSLLLATFHARPCFVQPFMQNILLDGEYSLFYFGGTYSHAIRKVPKAGDFRVQEEHGGDIQKVQPSAELLAAGQSVMSLIEPQPVYARIDFVRAADEQFLVMELELIEPSLYLRMDTAAAGRFAAAFDRFVLENRA